MKLVLMSSGLLVVGMYLLGQWSDPIADLLVIQYFLGGLVTLAAVSISYWLECLANRWAHYRKAEPRS